MKKTLNLNKTEIEEIFRMINGDKNETLSILTTARKKGQSDIVKNCIDHLNVIGDLTKKLIEFVYDK